MAYRNLPERLSQGIPESLPENPGKFTGESQD